MKLEESLLQGEKEVLVLHLPTSYGKSSITAALAELALENKSAPYFSRVIHVLPMRSIIDDLHTRLLEVIPPHFHGDVVKQYMLQPGSPFFAKKCIVTTLDSFLLNFFKLPAHELGKAFRFETAHFEFPRSMMYTSCVMLDEFHLFSGLGSLSQEYKSLNAVITAIGALAQVGVPVIVLTATLPRRLNEFIKEELETTGIRCSVLRYEQGADENFDRAQSRKRRVIKKYEGNILELFRKLRKRIQGKLAIVVNNPDRAIQYYRSLAGENALLLHGRTPQAFRDDAMLKLRSDVSHKLSIIATQVIESGLHVNFDALITEWCPIDRFIQRIGRVARGERDDHGEVWLAKSETSGPYDCNLVQMTWDSLPDGGTLDYKKGMSLVDEVYEKIDGPKRDHRFARVLSLLDYSPIFGLEESRTSYEHFKGFTDSAGLLRAYAEEYLDDAFALSADEKEAQKLLIESRKVLGRSTVEPLDSTRNFYEPLSISFMKRGYRGVVIDVPRYLQLTGLTREEVIARWENKKR